MHKHNWIRKMVTLVALLGPAACAPLPEFPFAAHADLAAPRIVSLAFLSATALEIGFDEHCDLVEGSLLSGQTLRDRGIEVTFRPSETVTEDMSALVLDFSSPPPPTEEHSVEAQVHDGSGNHLRFVTRFYGLNELLPAMLINEFTTQGSATHPDFVEILVLTDGNLAGACIYEGIPEDWDDRYVFPDVSVSAGDYVVVHFKPEGLNEEVNETGQTDVSGGRDASDDAWDFWVRDGDGLSGNNGVLTLCENPVGGVIDGVLYSNRTTASDDRYRGFGSTAVMQHAEYLEAEDAWRSDGQIRPEDGVNPDDSTATRSISRGSSGSDTNSRSDWHITPTRGLTPGGTNSDEVYEPG